MFRVQTKQESIAQAYSEKVVVFPPRSGSGAPGRRGARLSSSGLKGSSNAAAAPAAEAEALYRRVLVREPDDVNALWSLADLLSTEPSGREEAVALYRRAAAAAKPITLEETQAAQWQRLHADQHEQPWMHNNIERKEDHHLHKNKGRVKRSSKTTPPQAPSRRAGQKGSRGASPRTASKRDSPRSSEKRRPFNDYTARPYPRTASKRDSPRSSEKRRPFNDYTARPYPRNRKNRK